MVILQKAAPLLHIMQHLSDNSNVRTLSVFFSISAGVLVFFFIHHCFSLNEFLRCLFSFECFIIFFLRYYSFFVDPHCKPLGTFRERLKFLIVFDLTFTCAVGPATS